MIGSALVHVLVLALYTCPLHAAGVLYSHERVSVLLENPTERTVVVQRVGVSVVTDLNDLKKPNVTPETVRTHWEWYNVNATVLPGESITYVPFPYTGNPSALANGVDVQCKKQ